MTAVEVEVVQWRWYSRIYGSRAWDLHARAEAHVSLLTGYSGAVGV